MAAGDPVHEFLADHPWLKEAGASERSLRFNLMCDTGLEIDTALQDDDPKRYRFTGEHPERVVERAQNGDRVAHQALCDGPPD
ncbi:hypothetical protein [Mesorhizobium sp. CN2-181]|uniref:hypothetical protein n=1 Tax=Mesorhizobium yinganensis TaxID=3157707 RepID=UPI0032B6F97B